jgi:hypothetical protein
MPGRAPPPAHGGEAVAIDSPKPSFDLGVSCAQFRQRSLEIPGDVVKGLVQKGILVLFGETLGHPQITGARSRGWRTRGGSTAVGGLRRLRLRGTALGKRALDRLYAPKRCQAGAFWAPVSDRVFPISVSVMQRPVRQPTETGSIPERHAGVARAGAQWAHEIKHDGYRHDRDELLNLYGECGNYLHRGSQAFPFGFTLWTRLGTVSLLANYQGGRPPSPSPRAWLASI